MQNIYRSTLAVALLLSASVVQAQQPVVVTPSGSFPMQVDQSVLPTDGARESKQPDIVPFGSNNAVAIGVQGDPAGKPIKIVVTDSLGTVIEFAGDAKEGDPAPDSGPMLSAKCDAVATTSVSENASILLKADCTTGALIIEQVGAPSKRYISTGTAVDKSQVKATAGVLVGISARNSHASTDAYIKCTNATAANTTPGSTAIVYEMLVPHASGYVDRNINQAFDTAFTCYIAIDKADSGANPVAANDVSYNLAYR